MDWLGSAIDAVERGLKAAGRGLWGLYLRRRPWAVVLDIEHLERYLPETYEGYETPFQLKNRGRFDARLVQMAVKLGPKDRKYGYPQAGMDLSPGVTIPAGGSTPTASFPDMKAGKTRTGRLTWVDARGPHRQRVRIKSIGTPGKGW